MHGFEDNLKMAKRIASCVREAGGTAYFVGGFVRDRLMGVEGKDIDIEVHGLEPERLAAILDTLGERLTIGASFGVFGLRHYDIDIAMPRKEKATGRGHRDFEIYVDPFIGAENAARRRDFTINAMMMDVLSGEIIDCFGGREDLASRVIRHVNDASFAEDPLRVLRGAQFAARFGFEIAPETRVLCAKMDLTALPRERITGELEKALMKADSPAVFFEELRKMGQLEPWFTEAGEGDFAARMNSLNEAAARRERAKNPMAFMYAALCADMDAEKSEALLTRLTSDEKLLKLSRNLIVNAYEPKRLIETDAAKPDFMRLYDNCLVPEDTILLNEVTAQSGGDAEALIAYLNGYRELLKTPPVSGTDLVRAGLKPGTRFSVLLRYARDLWLEDVPHDEALRRTLELP